MIADPVKDLDRRCINTLRTLAIDQVQKANSGHPGTPMGAAPTAYCLWQRFLRFDPEDAAWPDRDRFVRTRFVFHLALSRRSQREHDARDRYRPARSG